MLAVAGFTDWNPSHFLDVAEMTFALAIGYDWLYHQLDEASRKTIRAAIIQKGVVLPLETRHKGWVKSRNNWGQVCHGGLTAGALAVMEDAPDLTARTVHNAVHNVTHAMAAYAPHGSYPEGPGYWAYGTSYNVLLIGVLESVLGTDFGLTRAPGFSETGQYPALACGPSGLFFNYADGGASRGPQPVRYWFASRFERPDWLLGEPGRAEIVHRQLPTQRRRRRGEPIVAVGAAVDDRAETEREHPNAAQLEQRRGDAHYRPPQLVDKPECHIRGTEGGLAVGQSRANGYWRVCSGRRPDPLGNRPRRRRLLRHRIAGHEPVESRSGFGPLDNLPAEQ